MPLLRFILFFLFLQTLCAWASPSGVFLVGESEGDDFHHLLRLEEGQATVRELNKDGTSARTLTFEVTSLGPNQYQLLGTEHGEPVRGYMTFTSEDEALLWFSGLTRLFWAIRTAPTDLSPLQGHWSALASNDIWEVDITEKRFEILRNGEKSGWTIHPVTNQSAQVRVVATPDGDTGLSHDESYLLYFVPLGPDFWLVRNHEEEHFLLLFREDSRAMMEAELEKRRQNPNAEEDEFE
jgi:hypothetical protein